MWDAIAKILTNSNALLVLIFLTFFILILIVLTRTGLVEIKTANFRMGADVRERNIIEQQTEWSHSYIMGLSSEIEADDSRYGGYRIKYILEVIHNEITGWITQNHINLESDYVSIKQEKVKAMLKSMDIEPQYKTDKFFKKTDRWVDEVIHKLVKIREVYK